MASANSDSGAVGALESIEHPPIMPHNIFSQQDLDEKYPSIIPPEDDHLDDIVNDSDDKVLQAGLREVEKIRQTMRTQGRRRRPLKDDSTHGTLSLCVETTKPANDRGHDQDGTEFYPSAATTTTTTTQSPQPNSEVEQARAERVDYAFGNDVAPLGECNALRVRRLAVDDA
jgi:hypothetical protein